MPNGEEASQTLSDALNFGSTNIAPARHRLLQGRGSLFVVEHQGELPPHFISAMSVTAERHVRVLAAAQAHVDNGVSKTCNGARDDTVESVDELYRLARELGCKAVSYYRDGSRES